MSTVAILGCGYVGRALGRGLVDQGHEVLGVCRSEDGLAAVEAAGLTPVRGDVTDRSDLEGISGADALVFSASSGGGGASAARSVYVDGLNTVLDAISTWERPPDRLLYTSSTGVYGDHEGRWVDETTDLDPATGKTEVLAEAETVARRAREFGTVPVVARLAGIYGPERYRLERYLEGPITEGYVNLVHRADVAGALGLLLTADPGTVPETVLVVDHEPVWKPTLAAWLAEQCDRAPPDTVSRTADGRERQRRGQKRCSNERLLELGYQFEYPTYREGYRAAIEDYRG
ncbi:MAG: NAD-dependent epimerase/dehydratase family protein [Halobacteriales archaeon]